MRPSKRALLCAGLALACLCGCAPEADTSTRPSVALVVKSTQTEFWRAVFAGAEAAAVEYNLDLTIAGPETEEDYKTQNQLLADAVENGTDAIVFSAIDFEKNADAIDAAAQQNIKIVAIDSNVDSQSVSTYIGTDNYAAGQMAAYATLERVSGPLYVGIVNYDVGTANGQERERGAVDAFTQSGRAQITAVVNTLVDADQAQADTAALLSEHPEINVLLALNEPVSVGAARAVQMLNRDKDVFFLCFDSNLVTIDGLQDGSVNALIVQNPYAMGYLGVESAYQLLSGHGNALEATVDTSTQVVDQSNLFSMDSQKALFAFG